MRDHEGKLSWVVRKWTAFKLQHLLFVLDPTGHYRRVASEKTSQTGNFSHLHLKVLRRVFKM